MFQVLVRRAPKLTDNVFSASIPMRNKTLMRVPVTDTSKLVPLVDETQKFVPVLHRRHEVPLRRINGPSKRMRSRHFVYDEIVQPKQTMADVEIILVKDVPGKGVRGTKLKIPGEKAYAEFLIPQYAVYATPENELKYASLIEDVEKNTLFSTLTAQKTTLCLAQVMVFFYMNMKNPWTIEKWHARVSFRQSGIILSEDCIELPKTPISGPDPKKEGKHFIVTVKINAKETAKVLCRVNHFISDDDQKLPVHPHFTPPYDPIFEEDKADIEAFVHNRSEIKRFKF
ncbi:hypothetical protein ONE63_010290 [Megalurothrips usitatus]|uniref:Ribosomal protein L9 domain-containing protein n=1 Tax=Megalurothrips usitatus TaxID=439358 RepID=A0AAV7XHD3_9NEOP|nr:hypothetical protein ONE63_010290 [Megalurothrips usitatus]